MDGRWHRGRTLAKLPGMLPEMDASARRSIVGGRGFDLAYLFGSSAAGALVGAMVLARPAWTAPAWWLFTLLVDGPHLLITVTRTYLDPRDRRRLGRALWLVPLWILLGPSALAASRITGSPAPWALFLAAAGTWSTYHFIRQHSGLLAICQRRAGAGREAAKIDGIFLQGALWTMTLLYFLVVPGGRSIVELSPLPDPRQRALALAIVLALAGAGLVWLGVRLGRARRSWLPVGFVIGPVGALYVFNLFVVGAHEPLFAGAANIEQRVLGVAVVGGLVHALQYLGIVAATNQRRAARPGSGAPAAPLRAPRAGPLATYAVFAAISIVAYGLLNAARGVPGAAFFGLESDAARLFVGIYWGLFFVHYHLDQLIWHPSRDPELRADLGLGWRWRGPGGPASAGRRRRGSWAKATDQGAGGAATRSIAANATSAAGAVASSQAWSRASSLQRLLQTLDLAGLGQLWTHRRAHHVGKGFVVQGEGHVVDAGEELRRAVEIAAPHALHEARAQLGLRAERVRWIGLCQERHLRPRLRVAIGRREHERPLCHELGEQARRGDGPRCIVLRDDQKPTIAGVQGSGKVPAALGERGEVEPRRSRDEGVTALGKPVELGFAAPPRRRVRWHARPR